MFCKRCGKELNIRMFDVGMPVDQEREYYCNCGAVFKGIPAKGTLEEVPTFVEKELK